MKTLASWSLTNVCVLQKNVSLDWLWNLRTAWKFANTRWKLAWKCRQSSRFNTANHIEVKIGMKMQMTQLSRSICGGLEHIWTLLDPIWIQTFVSNLSLTTFCVRLQFSSHSTHETQKYRYQCDEEHMQWHSSRHLLCSGFAKKEPVTSIRILFWSEQ
jgi:hypothetical protein